MALVLCCVLGACHQENHAADFYNPTISTTVWRGYNLSISPEPPNTSLIFQPLPSTQSHPTLEDFWDRRAAFVLDVQDTGLPMGESDTILMANGELWSYLHASTESIGVQDPYGNIVDFPGCTVIFRSQDGGRSFKPQDAPVCQFACAMDTCTPEVDHIHQQQYPRVAYDGKTLFVVYEYLGRIRMRRSPDGLSWSLPERVADTGLWQQRLKPCEQGENIGVHPFVPGQYDCLAGGPPGIIFEQGRLYIFVGLGQNPGGMGCYTGPITASAHSFTRCTHNPLFRGAASYGPLDVAGKDANPFFDFRTISSAEVLNVRGRFYMFYEGIRGPGPGDAGDTQFGLGMARSSTNHVDGPWEKFPGNPVIVDLPGNVGVGHADIIILEGQTILYTSLDGVNRSRLVLEWNKR